MLYWLAIAREPISLETLRYDMVAAIPQRQLLEAFQSLGQRSLVEKSSGLFSLQPVIMEYVGDRLITQIAADLDATRQSSEAFSRLAGSLFKTHSLIKAEAKDYVREAQIRTILAPLVNLLLASFPTAQQLVEQLKQILTWQRSHFPSEPGYLAGNVLNLLRYLEADLCGLDCSHLTIWQAHLDGANLCHVNFANADLSRSVLSETFASTLSLAFSPDGSLLATATTDNEICLWQVADGRKFLICQGHTGWVHTVAFSPCGTFFASGSEDETIRLWHVQTGQCIATLKGHSNWVWSVAFSPDGKHLASGSNDQTVRLWSIETEECLRVLQGHAGWVWSVAFSPDGLFLASGSTDHTIRLWEVQTGQCFNILEGHTHWVRCVAVHPTLPLIASSGDDQTIRLWDSTTGECLKVLRGHTTGIWSVAFSGDGRFLASGGDDRVVMLWDLETGTCFGTLKGHTNWIQSVTFSPDSQLLASASNDQTICLWNVATGDCLNTLHGHTHRIWVVGFEPAGSSPSSETPPLLISGGEDETLRCWDILTGECVRTLRVTRPYEAMNIHGVKGITNAQRNTLLLLGAIA